MNRKLFRGMFLFCLIGLTTGLGTASLPGDGTEDDPYELAECSDMQTINDEEYWDNHFELVDDISCEDEEFNPIGFDGDSENQFTGSFEGNDYTISNIVFDDSDENFGGLFSYIDTEYSIKNFKVNDIEIRANFRAGSIAGAVDNAEFRNIEVANADIEADQLVGVFAGRTEDIEPGDNVKFHHINIKDSIASSDDGVGGMISEVHSDSEVVFENIELESIELFGDSFNNGGLAGVIENDANSDILNISIEDSFIEGPDRTGSLVGSLRGDTTVQDVLVKDAEISVLGSSENDQYGGVFGNTEEIDGLIENIRISGLDLHGEPDMRVGGIAGRFRGDAEIKNVSVQKSIMDLEGDVEQVGGIVGETETSITDATVIETEVLNLGGDLRTGGAIGSVDYEGDLIELSEILVEESTIEGRTSVGGVVGYLRYDVELSEAVSKDNNITAETEHVGGVVGYLSTGSTSYDLKSIGGSIESVEGEEVAGYIIGTRNDPSKISESFAADISEIDTDISIIGSQSGDGEEDIENVYFDGDTVETDSLNEDVDELSTDEMTGDDAEDNLLGFDFEDVWETIAGDYPILSTVEEVGGPDIEDIVLTPEEPEATDSVSVLVESSEAVEAFLDVETSEEIIIEDKEMNSESDEEFTSEDAFDIEYTDETYTVSVTAVDEDEGERVDEKEFFVENNAPEVLDSGFEPEDPETGDMLSFFIEAEDPDNLVEELDVSADVMEDEEVKFEDVSLTYEGDYKYEANELFEVEETNVEYVIEYYVDDGNDVTEFSDSVFVGNSPPVFNDLDIKAGDLEVNDMVNLTADVEDPDGEVTGEDLIVDVVVMDENESELGSDSLNHVENTEYELNNFFEVTEELFETDIVVEATAEDNHESSNEEFEFTLGEDSSDDSGGSAPPPSTDDGDDSDDEETDDQPGFVSNLVDRVTSGIPFFGDTGDVEDDQPVEDDGETGDSPGFIGSVLSFLPF